MKLNLSFAILTAATLAFAASPADAASKKKKSKGSKAKVTVSKPAPAPATGYWASGFNNCHSASATMWLPLAAVGSVGCAVVYAVPVAVEGFVAPRSSKA